MVISTIEVRTATSGYPPPTHIRIRTTCSSTPLTSTLRMATISQTAYLSAASPFSKKRFVPSRALRSLPLSVMLSGALYWSSGYLNDSGTNGNFWASTPNSYTYSRVLGFYSTNVNPSYGNNKPSGLTLRCVTH